MPLLAIILPQMEITFFEEEPYFLSSAFDETLCASRESGHVAEVNMEGGTDGKPQPAAVRKSYKGVSDKE